MHLYQLLGIRTLHAALAAVTSVLVDGESNTNAADFSLAVSGHAANNVDLAVRAQVVILEDGFTRELVEALVNVLLLLGLGVGLLLSLLGTTVKAKHQVKSRLLLDVVVLESSAVL